MVVCWTVVAETMVSVVVFVSTELTNIRSHVANPIDPYGVDELLVPVYQIRMFDLLERIEGAPTNTSHVEFEPPGAMRSLPGRLHFRPSLDEEYSMAPEGNESLRSVNAIM